MDCNIRDDGFWRQVIFVALKKRPTRRAASLYHRPHSKWIDDDIQKCFDVGHGRLRAKPFKFERC
ncbi:hypothetical protein O9993_21335 [Vibrio lentus]|nr:hypothetical protein [Vibrio lentus]